MAEAREVEGVVADAREAVTSSLTLDAALDALASILSDRFTISRISVRTYHGQTDEIEIVAAWSTQPTQLGAGMRVPARSTSFSEIELREAAVLGGSSGPAEPLLDQIVRDEGNRSWVVIPLTHDRLVVGLLSVSSPELGAFTNADLPFFDALARAIGDRLLQLAAA